MPLDINTVFAFVSLIVAIIGAALAYWRWTATEAERLKALLEARTNDIYARIAAVATRQGALELDIAKNYVSDDRLRQMEQKFTSAIEKLINRFDAFATDFHKVVGRMERANNNQEN